MDNDAIESMIYRINKQPRKVLGWLSAREVFAGRRVALGLIILAVNITLTETTAAEIEMFKRAFNQVGVVSPLIHTNRGSAYTSDDFYDYLDGLNVTCSMSRPVRSYDNASMERWWNEFKSRWMARHQEPQTYVALVKLGNEGIEYFSHYNRSAQRNGLTPEECWREAA